MRIADVFASMLRSRWGVVVLVLVAGLGIAFVPWGYVATGGVLLSAHGTLLVDGSEVSVNAHRGSRMLRVEYASADPRHAVSVVNDFLRRQKDPLLLDEARVVRAGPGL